jgi:hypothetical protein
VILLGVALAAAATLHRRSLDARFAAQVLRARSVPFEIQRIRHDLAAIDLDEKTLEKELDARLAAAQVAQSEEFYLVLDTRAKKMSFRIGDRIVREAPLAVGTPRPIVSASGERFPPRRSREPSPSGRSSTGPPGSRRLGLARRGSSRPRSHPGDPGRTR